MSTSTSPPTPHRQAYQRDTMVRRRIAARGRRICTRCTKRPAASGRKSCRKCLADRRAYSKAS